MQISSSQKLDPCTVWKGYSTRKFQLLDKESTIGMEFHWEFPDPGHGNPPEKLNSVGNY
jgi:hypothetical protein